MDRTETRPVFRSLNGRRPEGLFGGLKTPCYIVDEAALRQRLSTAAPALEISLSDRPASPFDRALYPGKRSLLSAD